MQMKRTGTLIFSLLVTKMVLARDEIGPEGDKLIYVGLVVLMILLFLFLAVRKKGGKSNEGKPLFRMKNVEVKLEKDRLYFPDRLKLTILNKGNRDIDLGEPLLIFDNFWVKRKFKLKGTGNRIFYPLYLEKGKTHVLQIELSRFYGHDKKLKGFPKAKIIAFDVKGKRLGSKVVYMRKTLFKY